MSRQWEMRVPRNIIPRNCMEICAVWAVSASYCNHSKSCWWYKSLCRSVSSMTVLLCIQSYCTTVHILQDLCHEKKLHNTLSLLHYAEDVSEIRLGCLEPSSDNSVYSHNQTHVSDPCLTLVICLLRHCWFAPSPRILQNWCWLTLSHSLSFWATVILCG